VIGRVLALVSDLMDRSRITGALPEVEFVNDAAGAEGAALVVIDLARHAGAVAEVRQLCPTARIVAYGSHVDEAALEAARTAGADTVLPRSRFFRDPAAALGDMETLE
jgi:DNA-binding NarL/FixJ family response regulator